MVKQNPKLIYDFYHLCNSRICIFRPISKYIVRIYWNFILVALLKYAQAIFYVFSSFISLLQIPASFPLRVTYTLSQFHYKFFLHECLFLKMYLIGKVNSYLLSRKWLDSIFSEIRSLTT